MRTRIARRLALVFALLLLSPAPAPAADGPPSRTAPLVAGYWDDFVAHWTGKAKEQNGVVVLVLAAGAVGLFIITRGKWLK